MTKIKLCGLLRYEDIKTANMLKPDYIGFVFAKKSKRYILPEKAAELKSLLNPEIKAVGVFVNEEPKNIAALLNSGIIDIAQLHGSEDEKYIKALRNLTAKPIIQAFCIDCIEKVSAANKSIADCILLDSGAGTGELFNWKLLSGISRQYFLAGGLDSGNVGAAIKRLHPFAVDVSSGIEINGLKNKEKMTDFISAVRKDY